MLILLEQLYLELSCRRGPGNRMRSLGRPSTRRTKLSQRQSGPESQSTCLSSTSRSPGLPTSSAPSQTQRSVIGGRPACESHQ